MDDHNIYWIDKRLIIEMNEMTFGADICGL